MVYNFWLNKEPVEVKEAFFQYFLLFCDKSERKGWKMNAGKETVSNKVVKKLT